MEMNNCNSETDHAESLHIQMPSNHRKDDEAKTENAKEEKKPEPRVGVFQLFKFANGFDIFLMVIGSVFALCHGTMIPLMIIVFGKVIETFVNNGSFSLFLDSIAEFLTSQNLTKIEVENKPDILKPMCDELAAFYNNTLTCTTVLDNNADTMFNLISQFTVYMALMGLGVLVFGYAEVTYWMMSAERQTHRIRKKFFSNLLRQNIAWFDTNESTELNTRMTDDINKIHDGIGDKVGIILQSVSTFLSGLIIGFIFGWKLTLVMLSVSPVLMAAAILLNKLTTAATTNELKAYAIAGSIAEEVLGAIRTVAAFGGQKKELDRYAVNLNHAKKQGIKNGLVNGLSLGFLWFILFLVYALGFWYGAKLTRDEPENYNIGTMMTVFFSVFMAAFSLGTAAPHLQTLSVARGAACVIFNMIDQMPPIDSYSEEGIKLENMKGNVEFKNVHFEYPARTDVKILKGLNLKIDQGQTVAIVGSSGCGKSTIVQLIQRFYDPREGSLFIDGVNVKDLNVRWLRHQIGIVSQEPVLFGTTVSENIRYGCDGVTQEDIIEAAKKANAHDFIMKLPEKYDTQVGERGAQLSGGQKQRVAIARALVRNPKILLLDEATSALDTESESIVQDALDKARLGRTTVVIAHRLSTVKMADSIASLNNGIIVERGTHSEMMNLQGIYYNLVMSQTDKKDDTEYMEVENPKMVDFKKRSIHQSARVRSVSETQVKEKKPEEEKVPPAPFTRTIKLNAPEWPFILIGCVASLVIGATQPAFAVIFSEIMGAFQRHPDEQESFISLASLLYVGLALISFVAYLASGYSFGISGEALTYRLRKASFKSMLRQEIAYFDDHKNNVGALTTRLATDASLVKGATGVRLGTFFINISSLGTAVVIAFVYGWKLTLVLLAFFPFIAAAGGIEVRILAGVAGKNKEALEEAGKTALESIENIRTVVSLSKEPMFNEMYVNKLNGPHKAALKKAHLIGAAFGLSQGIVFFAYAACFWYGAELIKSNEMTFVEVMKVIMVVMFGAVSIGQASAFAPDAAKAGVSAQKIFMLLDKEPTIDSESAEGSQPSDYVSRICFRNVKFCYPTRPDVTVLKNFSLVMEPGQTVALVGTSGCGKSTTVQLIERFYDTEQGDVELDNKNIKDLNLSWLRSQMGIVSQEPVLFDRTIADNIAYGDNSRSVPIADIMEAAKAANIHNFISALPEGYNTNCGEKGAQLSGGQKQRIAIARALLRNPKILILDEATSALDTESEKIVQEALDEAQKGRTSIIIAHRLSTVQNADKIVVLDQGKIIEEGNHSSLMAKKGFYYMLHAVQNKQR